MIFSLMAVEGDVIGYNSSFVLDGIV